MPWFLLYEIMGMELGCEREVRCERGVQEPTFVMAMGLNKKGMGLNKEALAGQKNM